jgi:hypothetical protein
VFVTVAVIFAEEEFSGSEIGERGPRRKDVLPDGRSEPMQVIRTKWLKSDLLRCLRVCFSFQDGRGSEVAIECVRRSFQNQVAIGALMNMVRDLLLHSGREFSL